MAPGAGSKARLLIIDDSPSEVLLLETILEDAGYHDIISIHDPRRALATFRAYQPDLILLDLHMPHMSGLDVMDVLHEEIGSKYLPILVLTADISSEARVRTLSMGAKDFLTKPFDPIEVTLRIKNLLQTRELYKELASQNEILEQKVSARTMELETA